MQYTKEDIRRIVKQYIACCCNGDFETTTLNPPITAPTGNQPTVLFNPTTGTFYYYNGTSWVILSGGGFFTSSTSTGDTVQDANMNDFMFYNFSSLQIGFQSGIYSDGDNVLKLGDGNYLNNGTKITIDDSTANRSIALQSLNGNFTFDLINGVVPPTSTSEADFLLGFDSTTGRWYAIDNSVLVTASGSQTIANRYTVHPTGYGNATYSLPITTPYADGTLFTVKHAGDIGNVVTVDVENASSSIFDSSNVPSVTLAKGESRTFVYSANAAIWYII